MSFFHTFIKHLFGHDSFEIYLKGINALILNLLTVSRTCGTQCKLFANMFLILVGFLYNLFYGKSLI